MRRFLLNLFGLGILLGCQNEALMDPFAKSAVCNVTKPKSIPSHDVSGFSIVDGDETVAFPSVALIAGFQARNGSDEKHFTTCTATFVSANTLMTAAHCLDSSPTGGVVALDANRLSVSDFRTIQQVVLLLNKGIRPLVAIHHGATGSSPRNDDQVLDRMRHDLAFLVMPPDPQRKFSPIFRGKVVLGKKASVVGYGYSKPEHTQSEDVIKRRGTTVVSNWQPSHGIIHILSADADKKGNILSPSKYAYTAAGDSGGPLLVDRAVVGVLSGGSAIANGVDSALYVDLNSAESAELIKKAKSAGAVFEFEEGMEPSADSAKASGHSKAKNDSDGC